MSMARQYTELGNLSQVAVNMEVVREAYRQLDAGNIEGFYAAFADDVTAYDAEGLPYGGTYEGKAGFRTLTEKMFGAWEKVGWNLLELSGGGDAVVVHLILTFTPRGGKPFDHRILELWRIREGRTIEIRPFYYDTKLIADKLAGR
jgi:uncharacterized protein